VQKKNLLILVPLCLLFCGCDVKELPPYALLPNPEPFLESQGAARQDPVLLVNSFTWKESLYEQPAFIVGNKSVEVRRVGGVNRPDQDQSVAIYIDNKQVGRFMWWGSFKDGGFGYPFKEIDGDPATLKIDEATHIVSYHKPYLTPAGKRAVFSYTLKSLKQSKVELLWNLGVPQKELDSSTVNFSAQLWFAPMLHKGKKLVCGDKAFKEATREELIDSKGVHTSGSGNIAYNTLDPLKGYTLDMGDLTGGFTESIYVPKVAGKERYNLLYRTSYPGRRVSGRVVIDLGEAELPQHNAPPSVGGIDFWKTDGLHVPLPSIGNLMPNPSFEQGLRYWRWCGGGARYTPDPLPRYDIVPQGKFGKNALILRNTQQGAPSMRSFPMSLDKGKVYTLSFYAKAPQESHLSIALASAASGGKFRGKYGTLFGDNDNPDCKFKITTEWERYSRTFTMDAGGLSLVVSGGNDTLIDGIQIEEGSQPSPFVCVPLDGMLSTSDKDNSIVKGVPINAAFTFTGVPGTKGTVCITAKNAYREVVYAESFAVTLGADGTQKIPLPLDAVKFGEGIFVFRTECEVPGFEPYSDYYRLFIMTPLTNSHATRKIFGTLGGYARISRGEELAQKMVAWGFGSTSWGCQVDRETVKPEMEIKYGIANTVNSVAGQDPDLRKSREWTSITPEMEKHIEEVAFKAGQWYPELYTGWAFGNEEEGSALIRDQKFDEYFKAQYATAKGVKRANSKACILPTHGTSGYSLLRGYDAIEGYLKTARKHNFKYDAIAVHPYGNIDKGTLGRNDLDEESSRLIAQMKRYGYGEETPIHYSEMFNKPETYIPAWGADTSYDAYQSGKVSYDFGNREFIHACSAARAFIIMLKYWPHVQSSNIWVSSPYMDQNITPIILCKAVNTLGTHLGDVEYVADIKPMAGVRGYAFKLKDGSGIAAIWCVNHDVENGLKRGPVLDVKLRQPVEFIDLMGHQRFAGAPRKGVTKIQLTPAPLLMKANDIVQLSETFQSAQANDSYAPVQIAVQAELDGHLIASVKNLTGGEQSGTISVAGESLTYALKPDAAQNLIVSESAGNDFGVMYRWNEILQIEPATSDPFNVEWNMDYFYVPEVKGVPEWEKIPSIPLLNRFGGTYMGKSADCGRKKMNIKVGAPGDLEASFKMAWDKDNLYLRVEVEDNQFLVFPELWKKGNAGQVLYMHDGCLEVYFDTGADGRVNDAKTYDNNDYRYDFSIGRFGRSGAGMVYRLREVYHQLADGVNMASKQEAAEKIKCDFERTGKGYVYTITFGQRYIEPIVLRKGVNAGFGLFLHDRDDATVPPGVKGLSLATEPGSHCDYKPHLWPLMILSE
jgi:hypothetical protein